MEPKLLSRVAMLVMVVNFAISSEYDGGHNDDVDAELVERFEEWAKQYERSYKTEEEWTRRLRVWASNLKMIERENGRNHSHTLGMNQFGDMTENEFRAKVLGRLQGEESDDMRPVNNRSHHNSYQRPERNDQVGYPPPVGGLLGASYDYDDEDRSFLRGVWRYLSDSAHGMLFGFDPILGAPKPTKIQIGDSLPETVDWEKAGATSIPIMQGPCGACYAFASVGAIEALEFQQTGYLIPRSVHQMVACSFQTGNAGCTGGQFAPAFKYAMQQPLCQSDALYYTLENQKLASSTDVECRDGVRISGYSVVPENDEEQLKAAVAKQPVAAQVALKHVMSWMFLRGGILKYEKCGDTREGAPDHAVLIVGYGTHRDGTPYWKVKNSWGTEWGEEGYFYLERNAYQRLSSTRRVTRRIKAGTCQIASLAMYPKGPIEYEDTKQHCPARKPQTGILWFMPPWETLLGKVAYILLGTILIFATSTLINYVCFDEEEDYDEAAYYHRMQTDAKAHMYDYDINKNRNDARTMNSEANPQSIFGEEMNDRFRPERRGHGVRESAPIPGEAASLQNPRSVSTEPSEPRPTSASISRRTANLINEEKRSKPKGYGAISETGTLARKDPSRPRPIEINVGENSDEVAIIRGEGTPPIDLESRVLPGLQ
mmetsp:Transcript_8373/g.20571  ORF Transcript_8373/g.20571 Transcript_8373/m.20571 type:complete len:657 (+) Transcript_8373:406-2376(+)|eukprot:CAMPEP_0114487582 /NCGR_PEP_ID=MMETSP0109-20121206/851_1 /TAXON_ID=29199 /ORGANISM="Chlorarachnion reptans, Strain CCCM449" /LENGTH=656 /DNA_ID=CAMNT_0001663873 /DNA_START=279 /DNA_END=2249 /DNA_ORIENTATION=+